MCDIILIGISCFYTYRLGDYMGKKYGLKNKLIFLFTSIVLYLCICNRYNIQNDNNIVYLLVFDGIVSIMYNIYSLIIKK